MIILKKEFFLESAGRSLPSKMHRALAASVKQPPSPADNAIRTFFGHARRQFPAGSACIRASERRGFRRVSTELLLFF